LCDKISKFSTVAASSKNNQTLTLLRLLLEEFSMKSNHTKKQSVNFYAMGLW